MIRENAIAHAEKMFERYKDNIELYWICLPIALRNAVSVYEPKWTPWDKDRKDDWIRPIPENAISDESYFDFFYKNMEFEEAAKIRDELARIKTSQFIG